MATAKKANASKPPNEWTVMVYLAGDNNLSEEMIYAIKEMYRVGTNDQFEVIVEFDPSAIGPGLQDYVISRKKIEAFKANLKRAKPGSRPLVLPAGDGTFDADGFLTRLAERKKEKTLAKSQSNSQAPVRQPVPENSADPQVLLEFIRNSITNHRANHYMLVLSGHGSGAAGDFLPDNRPASDSDGKSPQGKKLKSELATSLSIPALGRVLKEALTNLRDDNGKRILIDILGMDSCLMGMAEVGFEVKDHVNYLVASEGFELNTGWPYHRILQAMKEKLTPPRRTLNAKTLAVDIVDKYFEYYRDYQLAGASTDISASRLGTKIKPLAKAVGDLAKALNGKLDQKNNNRVKDAIIFAHWEAQSYKGDQYVDLWDFCEQLKEYEGRGVPRHIVKKCVSVQKAIKNKNNGVVLKSLYSGAAFQHSHGISVFFPWAESDFFPITPRKRKNSSSRSRYTNLHFSRRLGDWVEFLRKYLEETRRERRNQADNLINRKPRRPLRFEAPNETVLFFRNTTSNSSRTSDSETGSMKNPPDGFYQDKA